MVTVSVCTARAVRSKMATMIVLQRRKNTLYPICKGGLYWLYGYPGKRGTGKI